MIWGDGVLEWWREERIERPTFNIQLPTLNERQKSQTSNLQRKPRVMEYWIDGDENDSTSDIQRRTLNAEKGILPIYKMMERSDNPIGR